MDLFFSINVDEYMNKAHETLLSISISYFSEKKCSILKSCTCKSFILLYQASIYRKSVTIHKLDFKPLQFNKLHAWQKFWFETLL